MKIRQLELKNFRCFDQTTFEFSDQFNVLIGDNGKGKTAFIEALVIIVGTFLSRFTGVYEPNIFISKSRIQYSDIREVRNERVEYVFPVEIFCKAIINEVEIDWSNSLRKIHNAHARSLSPITFADNLRIQVEQDKTTDLPLMAYYGTSRLWGVKKTPQELDNMKKSPVRQNRFWGYTDSLEPRSNLILDWFRFEDVQILLGQESFMIHEAISNALATCAIDKWTSMNYDANEDTLVVRSLDGKSQQFVKLSDGIKNMIGMVADIAYRAAVLNPHLETDAPKETQGVVLIDEIDLHLHPNWQRRVVDDLKRTFPKIQFFATTHSPFIIQSLHPNELIDLDHRDGEYYNKSIEDIAEDVMGVDLPQQSERWKSMMQAAEEYYRVLEQAESASEEEVDRLKRRLDELSMPYSDDPAYHAFLKMERLARGL